MSKYYFLLLWTGIIAGVGALVSCRRQETVLGRTEERIVPWMAVVAFVPLVWFAGTRTSFADTRAYIEMYQKLPATLAGVGGYLETVEKDRGFTLLSILIKTFAGDNYGIYFTILAVVQAACLIAVYRKYSESFFLALFVFVASTDYMSWMHNGIRQFTAVTIIFAATPLMLEKKYGKLILTILLASTIHKSALLMIPIVFVVRGPAWNRKSLLAIAAAAIAIIFADRFTGLMDAMLADTQYSGVVGDWTGSNDDGTNLLRVLVYAVPTILSVIGLPYIKEADDPVVNLACNMGIMSTALYALSAVTSGIYVGRLPIFCSLYSNGILLPWLLGHMFSKSSQKFLYTVMIGAYVLFYYYQMHGIWGLI